MKFYFWALFFIAGAAYKMDVTSAFKYNAANNRWNALYELHCWCFFFFFFYVFTCMMIICFVVDLFWLQGISKHQRRANLQTSGMKTWQLVTSIEWIIMKLSNSRCTARCWIMFIIIFCSWHRTVCCCRVCKWHKITNVPENCCMYIYIVLFFLCCSWGCVCLCVCETSILYNESLYLFIYLLFLQLWIRILFLSRKRNVNTIVILLLNSSSSFFE